MRWGDLSWVPGEINMNLYHYEGGPILPVKSRQFIPNQLDQIQLWGKTPTGWRCEETAALGLSSTPSDDTIARYITECIPYCAVEASKINPQLQAIIQTASQSVSLSVLRTPVDTHPADMLNWSQRLPCSLLHCSSGQQPGS